MFGFVKGPCGNQLYRQVYSGCCAVQHREYGLSSLVFLSYEAILVYLFALDARQCEKPPESAVTCCRLRRNEKVRSVVDPQLAQFSAAFGVLLASIKLDDDVHDDRSLLARFVRWRFKRKIAKANRFFESLDSEFTNHVKDLLLRHKQLEQGSRFVNMQDYVRPTADAFGYVFELAKHQFSQPNQFSNDLRQLGEHVGAAIIAFDCAVDWERDRRKKSFNPLPDQDAVGQSLLLSRQELAKAIWLCRDLFGANSLTAATLKATFDRVCRRSLLQSRRKPTFRQAKKSNWAALRRGDCCPCEACCEAGELCGKCGHCCECLGAGEGGGGDCGNCDCGNCDCCTISTSEEKQKKTTAKARPDQPNAPISSSPSPAVAVKVGSRGVAMGPLNPSGVARFNGSDYPVKTSGRWINDGEFVEVVAFDSFGLLVVPSSDIIQP